MKRQISLVLVALMVGAVAGPVSATVILEADPGPVGPVANPPRAVLADLPPGTTGAEASSFLVRFSDNKRIGSDEPYLLRALIEIDWLDPGPNVGSVNLSTIRLLDKNDDELAVLVADPAGGSIAQQELDFFSDNVQSGDPFLPFSGFELVPFVDLPDNAGPTNQMVSGRIVFFNGGEISVPEPAPLTLLMLGFAAAALTRRFAR